MAPRIGDWAILAVVVAIGGVWAGRGMPGLPANLIVHPVAPLTMPTPEPSSPPVDYHVVAAPRLPLPALAVTQVAPPVAAPARPPLPSVIGPSGGETDQEEVHGTTIVSTLPVVIRPSDPSQAAGESGTGFFISRDGSLVTAAHVVQGCKTIQIASRHLKATPAQILAADPKNDLAVLRAINVRPAAVIGLAERPHGRENLAIFGYPGDGDTLTPEGTSGILLTDHLVADGVEPRDWLWIDAGAIRPGFSGGPVLTTNGEAIGAIKGQVVLRAMRNGVRVRDVKYAYGPSTKMISEFLSNEVPMLVPDGREFLSLADVDKAIVHILCLR